MRVALDTNRYVDLCKGVKETTRIASTADTVVMPFIVIAELRAGFALGRRGVENEQVLRRFLLKEGVEVISTSIICHRSFASEYRFPQVGVQAVTPSERTSLHDAGARDDPTSS